MECVTVHVPLIQSTEGSELAAAAALEYFEGRQSDIDSAMMCEIVLIFFLIVMRGKESRHGGDSDGQEKLGASDGRRPGRLVGYIWGSLKTHRKLHLMRQKVTVFDGALNVNIWHCNRNSYRFVVSLCKKFALSQPCLRAAESRSGRVTRNAVTKKNKTRYRSEWYETHETR